MQCGVIGLGIRVSFVFILQKLFLVVVAKQFEGSFIQRNFPYKRLLIF